MAEQLANERRAYQVAIVAGVSPADALDALRDAREAGQALPTEVEIAEDAEITDEDKERSRQWWIMADFVPDGYDRLLYAELEAAGGAEE